MSIQGDSSKKSFVSIHDRPSLHAVRGKYEDLNNLMDSLSEKLNVVASAQEKEFLSAYRVHMLSVQLELKELKEKVAKAEMSLQDDGEVSKLEEECNWFRMETNRLQTQSSTMQTDIRSLKNRLGALKDQNEYLSNQLKAVMKRSRVLEVEIEMGQQAAEFASSRSQTDHSVFTQDIPEEEEQGVDEEDCREEDSGRAMSKSLSAVQLGHQRLPTMKRQLSSGGLLRNDALVPLPSSPSRRKGTRDRTGIKGTGNIGKSKSMPRLGTSSGAGTRKSGRGIRGVGRMEGDAAISYEDELRKLSDQLSAIEEKRTPLELELEACVEATFENIIRRRSVGVARNSKNRYFQSIAKHVDDTGVDDLNNELENAMFSSATPVDKLGHSIAGGITNYGIEHFTDADRLSTVVNFLSNESTFNQIVRHLQNTYSTGSADW